MTEGQLIEEHITELAEIVGGGGGGEGKKTNTTRV